MTVLVNKFVPVQVLVEFVSTLLPPEGLPAPVVKLMTRPYGLEFVVTAEPLMGRLVRPAPLPMK